jgi:hypothetical protein
MSIGNDSQSLIELGMVDLDNLHVMSLGSLYVCVLLGQRSCTGLINWEIVSWT